VPTWNGFSTAWVGNADEFSQQNFVLLMVPVAKDDCELFIVRIGFLLGMQSYRSAKAIDILTLQYYNGR
jgi:hypothetical protein